MLSPKGADPLDSIALYNESMSKIWAGLRLVYFEDKISVLGSRFAMGALIQCVGSTD